MTYTVTIATPAERDLIVEAVRAAAAQRIRVATKAAGTVKLDKLAKREHRASAVRVAMLLAEADTLTELANELETMTDGPAVVGVTTTPADEVIAAVQAATVAIPFPAAPGDDGTSPEAQRIAALAGLRPDLPEDPETGANAEDELDTPAEIDLGGPE